MTVLHDSYKAKGKGVEMQVLGKPKFRVTCLMCLAPVVEAMGEELAAVWVCRQPAERVLGLAAGKNGKLLVTVQGDGVITYSAAKEASGHSRALGSSHAQFLAPVQQLGNNYIAAVQQGSTYGVLLTTPVASQHAKPLLDAEQRLPLPAKLHSLHALQTSRSSSGTKSGPGVAAVVLVDGTVAAADFGEPSLHPVNSGSPPAASSPSSSQQRPGVLTAACDGELLAVAQQAPGAHSINVDVYAAISDTAEAGTEIAQQQQQPRLQVCHSCSLPQPTAGSKLVGLSVSHDLLVLLWSCHNVSVYHGSFLGHAGSAQAGHTTQLQLPTALAAIMAAAATAGGEAGEATPERPGKRKQRPNAAATTAGCSWSAVALSGQHVLLLVVQNEAGSSRAHYAVVDSMYGSCLSSGAFAAGAAGGGGSSSSSQLQLLPLPQHPYAPVAMLAAGSVWLLPLKLPKADLAGLVAGMGLGSKHAQAAAATAGAAAGRPSQPLLSQRQHLNLSSIAAAVSSSAGPQQQQRQLVVLQQLQQPAAAAAAAEAALPAALQQLQRVLDMQQRPAQEVQAAVSQLCDVLEQQQQASAPVLISQPLVAQALSALADAQQWQLLERLHQLQPLQSLAACGDLVPTLAAAQQYSCMRRVLLAAQEVPAEAVVSALQHILQQQQPAGGPVAAQAAAGQQIRAAAEVVVREAEGAAASAGPSAAAEPLVQAARAAAVAVDGFTSRELLLHVLLSVQVDGVEAQAALRALPAAAVLRLLRYLLKWLRKYSRDHIAAASTDPLLVTPSAAQVLEWIKLLLDAQLTKLMLLPVARPLLLQLQHVLQAEVSCTSKLLELKGVTDTWATGAPLPAAAVAANSQYVLELLDLRVKQVPAAAAAAGHK